MTKLRVSGLVKDSLTDGPGIRLVVFTQGCDIRCPGCQNPHTWDPSGGHDMTTEEILRHVTPLTTGISISGGEPTMQWEAVLELLSDAKSRGLSTMVFSGRDSLDQYGISNIDMAKLGPYVEKLRCIGGAYGSTNQRIVHYRNNE